MHLESNQVLGVILAHAKAKPIFLQHLPYWFKICDRLIVVTPEKQKLGLNDPRIEELEIYPDKGSYSTDTNRRCWYAMKAALERQNDTPYVMLFEYDSLCWSPIPTRAAPAEGEVACTVWPNEPVTPIPGKPFIAPFYMHFPHLYSRTALEKIVEAMETTVPWDAEWGYTDRYVGLAAYRSGVSVKDWRSVGLSYSYENISYSGRFPQRVEECVRAVKLGAFCSHGVKDERTLKRIAPHGKFGLL